jgi:5-methylcytosine-specific restriction endonuclease McrA
MFNFLKKIRYAERSYKWQTVRKEHLKNNPSCIACGRNKKLEVHHIKPVHLHPELELDPSNLVTLCADPCHILFGHLMDFKSWNKDVVEDSNQYINKVKNKPKE